MSGSSFLVYGSVFAGEAYLKVHFGVLKVHFWVLKVHFLLNGVQVVETNVFPTTCTPFSRRPAEGGTSGGETFVPTTCPPFSRLAAEGGIYKWKGIHFSLPLVPPSAEMGAFLVGMGASVVGMGAF